MTDTDKPVVTEDDMRLARKLAREFDTLEGRARIALALAETRRQASWNTAAKYVARIAELEAENARLWEQFAKNAIWSPAQKQACINEIQGALTGSWSGAETFALHLVSTIHACGEGSEPAP